MRFDRVDVGSGQDFVERREVALVLEHDIGGVLDLPTVLVIAGSKVFDRRTAEPRVVVEASMQLLGVELVGETLGFVEVGDLDEGIVEHAISDVGLVQLGCEQVVAVEVELNREGAPRRHADIAEPKLLVDEVEK